MTRADCDVLVLGGGLTGIAFALLLAGQTAGRRTPLRIAVVEAGPAPPLQSAAQPGLRVVALSPASRTLLEECQAWSGVPPARIGAYRRMVVWRSATGPGGATAITFDAAEEGVAELGHIVENDLVRSALWRIAVGIGSIELIADAPPVALDLVHDAADLELADKRRFSARLIVGADGHESWLRKAIGIASRERPYGQQAVVAHVASERPHGETAWQRFLDDGTVALLPLADGRCSLVWSCAAARGCALVAATESDFNRALMEAVGGVLGELSLTTARVSFPLAAGHAAQYTGRRFALIGDAAHRVHPLAGQGVNLGFQDAAVLAQTLAEHLTCPQADPGDPLALRRYERGRKGANLAALIAMDAMHGLFTSRITGVAGAAGYGLGLVDRLSPLKSRLADYALGRRGNLPRVIRAAPGPAGSGSPGQASGGA